MISILIPVYNYSIENLVNSLLLQGSRLGIPYEIIIREDCSSHRELALKNQLFCKEKSILYIFSTQNLGSAVTRNLLAKRAQYGWLLFLDADVIPVFDNFLEQYVSVIKQNETIYSGNVMYNKSYAKRENNLRWLHGNRYEKTLFDKDNTQSLQVKSANFLIKKDLFLQMGFPVFKYKYGFEDTYFGLLLHRKNIDINLVDNPVYHYGLESNNIYLRKVEEAMKNIADMIVREDSLVYRIRIASFYKGFRSLHLDRVIRMFFSLFRSKIKRNLISNHPNIHLLQFYKIGYLCELFARK